MGNPIELNRYVYTANNPVRYTDPSGYSLFERASIESNIGSLASGGLQQFGWAMFEGAVAGALGYIVGVYVAAFVYEWFFDGNQYQRGETVNFDEISARFSVMFSPAGVISGMFSGLAMGGFNFVAGKALASEFAPKLPNMGSLIPLITAFAGTYLGIGISISGIQQLLENWATNDLGGQRNPVDMGVMIAGAVAGGVANGISSTFDALGFGNNRFFGISFTVSYEFICHCHFTSSRWSIRVVNYFDYSDSKHRNMEDNLEP